MSYYYRPVAMTSISMKMFERLILNYLKSVIPKDLDPFQFAYRANRSAEDAVLITLHNVLTHQDLSKPTYVRILFIDFSSAFKTILPFKLHSKLLGLGIARPVCDWILHFLLARHQDVRLGFGAEAIALQTASSKYRCSTGLCLLRRLKSFGFDKVVLLRHYRAVIESVFTLSITVWYGKATAADRALRTKIRNVLPKL